MFWQLQTRQNSEVLSLVTHLAIHSFWDILYLKINKDDVNINARYGIYDEARIHIINIDSKIAKILHVFDKNVAHDRTKIEEQENLAH